MNKNNKAYVVEQENNNVSNNNALAPESEGVAAVNMECGYYHDKEGHLWQNIDGKDPILISESYIKAESMVRTIDSFEWSKRIRFEDMDRKIREIDITCKTIFDKNETLRTLADAGFSMSCIRPKVVDYLISAEPEGRLILIKQIGWIDNTSWTCPSFSVPTAANFSLACNINNCGFAIKGSLKGWQEYICTPSVGNVIPTFAFCHSFTGSLLKYFPEIGTTAINLVGSSSIGKTSILMAAASIWGYPKKFTQQWRATANALEAVAESHNDCLLILDELSQISGKEAGIIVYTLSNEKGKHRSKADSELKRCREWRISILSSGEIGIEDKLREEGMTAKAGHFVRFIDIDANISEHGIYESLNGFSNGSEVSNYLKEKSSQFYGIAAKEFITRLVAFTSHTETDTLIAEALNMFPNAKFVDESPNTISAIRNIYTSAKNELYRKFDLSNADGQAQRVAAFFALCETAGKLACRFEIFTHTEQHIEEAVIKVFERWLSARGGIKSHEEQTVIEHVISFLMQHEARFRKIGIIVRGDGSEVKGSPEDAKINCLGYMAAYSDRTIYYINPKLFKEEICKNLSLKMVRKILIQKGILDIYEDGRDKYAQFEKSRERMVTLTIKNN